ncbi:hybrid sensor histidine kinase/response regulator [Wenyingzhuangia fucanilytica]|uniref:histidine kinase n=1 Tax=Wenyingzhuangia fucanilytica TaxID=1790137 RepID=A0A1B1Y517_9FLAO|nr:hybrid sensor histidine kinase/response regulator transcription factor [Wenyingzhuangia fucanilytica]ANW95850.1 hybrid sensor histidine kinase/response regulator [Wenyingzhuangia fucanilytica]
MSKFIAFCFVFFISFCGFSQNEIYKFIHLTTEEGLSQSSVMAITQDDLGQIWIGTRDGLNKYDGTEFTLYRNEKNNPSSLSYNDILCLESDSSGYIWVGTFRGLNKYDSKKNTFKKYFKSDDCLLADNIIWCIKELSNKEIWIGTPLGLSIYNKNTDSFKTVLNGNQILSVFETKNGNVFVATKNGLKKLVDKTNNYQFKTVKGTEDYTIQDIVQSPKGNLLLGTKTHSVLEYNILENKITPYFTSEILIDKNKNARQLLFDDKDRLWIGTYKGLQIANNNNKITTLYNNINDDESINDNFIKVLYKDKKGSIWVGTYLGGINIWDESNINFINITQKSGTLGLGFKAVSSITKYRNLVFFGTEGGGISILNTKSKTFKYINLQNSPSLKSDNIKALYLTNDKKLWIGTFQDGVAVYNIETQKFENKLISKDLSSYLSGIGVVVIKEDKKGNLLFGTTLAGVISYNRINKSFDVINSKSTTKNITNNSIKSIEIDSKNNIWIGTLKGLNKIDEKGNVKKYFYKKSEKEGNLIYTIFEDSKGGIWVGSDVDGLYKFINGTFEKVKIKINNIDLIGVRGILEDDKGEIWISSYNQGIFNYDPINNIVKLHYTQKEGLISNQFNTGAFLNLGKSRFFFGGPKGVSYFDANSIIKNKYLPQVIITDFKIKNKSIEVNDESGLLQKTISRTNSIELSHEQGNFSIAFSIPNYINSKSNKYKYRLKGLEKEWIETSNNLASYTIQTPGSYIFEIKGVNSDGLSNNTPTVLNIKVNPAPWRTWWAFMFYGMFLFTMLYFLMNILKSRTKLRHQLDLEQIEAEQIKKVNKAKLEFFTNISHEFRTPLTLILGPLHQILVDYRGSSKMYKRLKVIEGSANHLLQLINRLMDFRKLESNLIKLEAAEGNIVKFLKEIYLSFSEYAKDGNYEYSFYTSSEKILVYYDRYKLERVFYNLISNAFRYTPKNGKIAIRIIEKNDKIIIQVEDSGVGVAKEYQDKIFERFYELAINNKPDNDYNKGTGIGLSIVKNIVDLHKGRISVRDNENNQGSIFSVELFLGRNHLNDNEIIKDFKFSDDLSQYVIPTNEQDKVVFEEDFFENLPSEDKPTVLLVEDNKPLRQFMHDTLIKEYNVLEAENGKVAYKIAKKEKVDIIISDVVMPVMAGTDLCSLIKEDIRTSHIPVILLTSRSALIFRLEGLESGADDYISKPFNVAEFKLRIKNILSSVSRLKQKMNSTETVYSEDLALSSLDEKLYQKALQLVEKNIGNEQYDVDTFSEELGVSRSVLFRKIKAWTDFTPKEFIQHIRLKKAADLLELGELNISQVSYIVGFKNPKYFSKSFSKKFGVTPTMYIKKFTEN